ncbi:MAG TPA: thioredoxin domain-containing protein [Terriglobales bacterium]|nr:thioredoxin domain-containing protein [Terriglobales bacterium]
MQLMRKLFHCALLCATLGSMAIAQNPTEVVSEVNGEKITRAELEQKQGNRFHQARYALYQAEQKALDDVIDEHLLAAEAKRANITVEKLLDREVMSKVKDPTEDQLQVYFEGLNSKDTYESVRVKILEHIRQLRQAKARGEYLEKLRTASNVLITLAPPKADINLKNTFRFGPEAAPVQIVEFADFECPYCSKAHPQISKLRQEFAGKISVVFKDLPLPMHSHAWKSAEAARCAGTQGKYWEYHDLLFTTNELDPVKLKQHARTLGLDAARFDKCLDSGEQTAAVTADFTEAQQLGITGTPSFFLNGQFFTGALEYNTLRDMVQKELNRKPAPVSQVSQVNSR